MTATGTKVLTVCWTPLPASTPMPRCRIANPLRDDLPVRTLYIDPLYLDEAEVINARYAADSTNGLVTDARVLNGPESLRKPRPAECAAVALLD